jgi:hypothetical protein
MITIPARSLGDIAQRYPFDPESWQGKAILATHGNRGMTGTVLLACLGQTPPHPPALGLGAVITSDGFVMCDFVGKDGVMHTGAFLDHIDLVIKAFRLLADHLKLGDEDREKMFLYLRGWIKKDWRANPPPIGGRTSHDPG